MSVMVAVEHSSCDCCLKGKSKDNGHPGHHKSLSDPTNFEIYLSEFIFYKITGSFSIEIQINF